jgi:hypothetical protein
MIIIKTLDEEKQIMKPLFMHVISTSSQE